MKKNLLENSSTNFFNNLIRLGILVAIFQITPYFVDAQTNGSVGIGTTAPYTNAALDVSSTTKGVLFPRLSATERVTLTALLTNATTSRGLLIYNTTTARFNYWDGTQWNDVGAGASGADGTIWYAGQGVPSNSLGKTNDFYLDGVTGDVYSKDLSNTWVRFGGTNPVNLKNTNKREITAPAIIVAANSATVQTFTYANAAVGSAALCSPTDALPNGIIVSYARVSATNTVEVKFYNATGAAITIPAAAYEIVIF